MKTDKNSYYFWDQTWVCGPFWHWITWREIDVPQVSDSINLVKFTVASSRTGELHLQVTCCVYILRLWSMLLKLPSDQELDVAVIWWRQTGLCILKLNPLGALILIAPISDNFMPIYTQMNPTLSQTTFLNTFINLNFQPNLWPHL